MGTRILIACLITAGLVVGVALAAPGKTEGAGEHDFGTKVLGISTRGESGKSEAGGGYMEKAKLRLLGDRYFLVGQVPDMNEKFKETKGTVMWIPLSEVVQIIEYDNVAAVMRVYAEFERAERDK